ALPAAAPRAVEGEELPWREEPKPSNSLLQGAVGYAVEGERAALARNGDVVVFARPSDSLLQGGDFVVHDAKALRVSARDDTLLAAYLIEPGRASYELDDLAAEYGVGVRPTPEADAATAA